MLTWEIICSNSVGGYTERLPVPGGWLVRTNLVHDGNIALTFVVDKNHSWEVHDYVKE